MVSAFLPIEQYALIGNCRTAALVGSHGSIDWLCLPRFDGPSVFGALLDAEQGGRFRVAPSGGGWRVERRYVGPTAILETTFRGPDGALRITDFMPVTSETEKTRRPWPDHHVVRRVQCLEGQVEVQVEFVPRPAYGRVTPLIESRGRLGFWCQTASESLALLSDLPLEVAEHGQAIRGRERLGAGERRELLLTYATGEPNVLLPSAAAAEHEALTHAWWSEWSSRCTYDGPWLEAVLRSAITLKLLTYAPSGAVVAAPTTSLPESLGGVRNWDYRFCWLRDASWTLRALFGLGYQREATAFFDWLVNATRLTAPAVQTVYDLHGEPVLTETELVHLEGYRQSQPVRVGNQAADQLQLDVYGEVVSAAREYVRQGGKLDQTEIALLAGFGETVMRRWREPDEGIWEVRRGRRHHVYSKVMCAVALECLIEFHEQGLLEIDVERLRSTATEIRDAIQARGYDADRGIYVATFDGDRLDAALLRLPLEGFIEAGAPPMRRTAVAIWKSLGRGSLLSRYHSGFDGLGGGEGAFGLATFWSVEVRALAGDLDLAVAEFEAMLARANDVGLYSEEIDPDSGGFLGNFPQAFTHLGLINAALTLRGVFERPASRP